MKNSEKYQFKIHESIKLGLFPLEVVPKPVMCIVYVRVFAAFDADIDFPNAQQHKYHHNDKFTVFDVWCAGLAHKAVKHIDSDLGSHRPGLLLERSLRPHDAFCIAG